MTTKITDKNISNLANIGVQWQSVFTGDGSTGLTAVAGRGYFINTTSGTVTVTLPASPSAGDVVVLKDYARTWATNNVTMASALFEGITKTNTFSTDGQTITLVYMDGTKGWSLINEDTTSNIGITYITATGGTVTTSGDYKIHTFTGDGCFVVSSIATGTATAPNVVDYLVVAGGGGGGQYAGAAGGAGGFRESKASASPTHTASPHTASPLAATSGITVTATTYPITVGAGGASSPNAIGNTPNVAPSGSNSVFSTITSAGGGGGAGGLNPSNGASGGSGGGGAGYSLPTSGTGGSGNTPPVNPPQGNSGHPSYAVGPVGNGGGGGGATAAGSNNNGGAGAGTQINPAVGQPGPSCLQYFSGGGAAYTGGTAGIGGGGPVDNGGTANTGGGSGGDANTAGGGKGIVVIRYKFQ